MENCLSDNPPFVCEKLEGSVDRRREFPVEGLEWFWLIRVCSGTVMTIRGNLSGESRDVTLGVGFSNRFLGKLIVMVIS